MRRLSILLLLFLLAAVFCGCANGQSQKRDANLKAGNSANDMAAEPKTAEDEATGTTGNAATAEDSATEAAEDTEPEIPKYVKPEMKGEITISCFFEEELLDTAAKQFMEKYPDIKVTINEYGKSSDQPTPQDYQAYFNTKLMGKDAEDIIFNSFLPVTKYSEMGAFEDLSTYIRQTPEMNDKNYYMNVLNAAKRENGEVYLIPYMARLEILGFDADLLKGQEAVEKALQGRECIRFSEGMELAGQLARGSTGKNVFLTRLHPVQFTDYLIKDSLDSFIDMGKKKVNINTPEYIRLLNSVKEISDGGYFNSGIDFYNTEYTIAAVNDYDVQAASYAVGAQPDVSYCMPLVDGQGNVAVGANGCVAINSACGHKDLAWEFLKYFLSEEIQCLPAMHGLAVNRQGFEQGAERYYKFYSGGSGGKNQKDYRDLLENWMEQVNACDVLDSAMIELMEAENGKFFDGQQTAEETAKKLQRQMEQYFYE